MKLTNGRYQPGMIVKIRNKHYRIIPIRQRGTGRGSILENMVKAVLAKGEAHR